MTALEVYDLTTKGGGTDLGEVVRACESAGDYCLIGGLAVNCFVEPVYTLDADIVVVAEHLPAVSARLQELGYRVEVREHSVNAQPPGSDLRVQFTTDTRYQSFPSRAVVRNVLGTPMKVACLEDVTAGKLWAYSDPHRRLSKRKKDELDLIRLAEAYPRVRPMLPPELRGQLGE